MSFLESLNSVGFTVENKSVDYQKEDFDLSSGCNFTLKFELIIEELLNMQKVVPWHKIKDHNGTVSFNFPKGFQLIYSVEDMVLNIRKDKVNTYCMGLIYSINHANAFMFISIFLTLAAIEDGLFNLALLQIYSNFAFLEQPTEEETLRFNRNLSVHD